MKKKPAPFSDSFTTMDACFSVEVKDPWGEVTEDIEVKIDCGGMIHGDEDLIDVLIEMLENAKMNLIARRGKLAPALRVKVVGKKPVTKKPVTKKPAAKKPVAKK